MFNTTYFKLIYIIVLLWVTSPVLAQVVPVPNGGFEANDGAAASGWTFAKQGAVVDKSAPHSGSACVRVDNDGTTDVSIISDQVPFTCNSPRRILVRAWAKADNLEPGNQGWKAGRLIVYAYDKDGKGLKLPYTEHAGYIGDFASFAAGTFGWKEFTGNFVLPAGTESFRFTAGSSYAKGTIWFDDFSVTELPLKWQPKEDSHATFSIDLKHTNPKPVIGIGWNWEFVWGGPTELETTDAYIDQLLGFASWDEQSFIRFGYKAEFCLNKNMPDWATNAPHVYKKVLNGLEAQQKTVLACNWSYGRDPANLQPPYPAEEFAGTVAEALKRWLAGDKLNCIKYVSLWNEPCWSYEGKYPEDFLKYNKAFDAALKNAGVRGQVKLVATDTTENGYAAEINFPIYDRELKACADAYGAHDYAASVEAPEPEARGGFLQPFLVAYEKAAKSLGEKPLMLTEFGSGYEEKEDAYRGLLGDAELVVGGLNAGVRAFSRWAYNTPGGYCPFDGTGNVTPKPSHYYGYSILTKAIRSGAKVAPVTLISGGIDNEGYKRVHCAMLVGPDDKLALIIINDGRTSKKISLKGLPGRKFYHYSYDSTLPSSIQQRKTLQPKDNSIVVTPGSINALVTWQWSALKPIFGKISVDPGTKTGGEALTLRFSAASLGGKVVRVRLRSDNSSWTNWLTYSPTRSWKPKAGAKMVFAQFQDSEGNISAECGQALPTQ